MVVSAIASTSHMPGIHENVSLHGSGFISHLYVICIFQVHTQDKITACCIPLIALTFSSSVNIFHLLMNLGNRSHSHYCLISLMLTTGHDHIDLHRRMLQLARAPAIAAGRGAVLRV